MRLCTICARGGSKGVPGKNLRLLLGKPLIVHTIEQAKASGLFVAIAVSSDTVEILQVASNAGADHVVHRPTALATDEAPKLPAIQHCLEEVERVRQERFDVLVDLDATSPLRSIQDIDGAVRLLEATGATNVITGTPARRSPYFNMVERDSVGETVRLCKALSPPVARRQDAPTCFDMNASIYVWRAEPFRKAPGIFFPDTRLYEMPYERSIDIDSEVDFQVVEMLLRNRS